MSTTAHCGNLQMMPVRHARISKLNAAEIYRGGASGARIYYAKGATNHTTYDEITIVSVPFVAGVKRLIKVFGTVSEVSRLSFQYTINGVNATQTLDCYGSGHTSYFVGASASIGSYSITSGPATAILSVALWTGGYKVITNMPGTVHQSAPVSANFTTTPDAYYDGIAACHQMFSDVFEYTPPTTGTYSVTIRIGDAINSATAALRVSVHDVGALVQ
jgi:hypothetical protein